MNGHFHSLTKNHRTTFNYTDTSVQKTYIRNKTQVLFVGQKIEKWFWSTAKAFSASVRARIVFVTGLGTKSVLSSKFTRNSTKSFIDDISVHASTKKEKRLGCKKLFFVTFTRLRLFTVCCYVKNGKQKDLGKVLTRFAKKLSCGPKKWRKRFNGFTKCPKPV